MTFDGVGNHNGVQGMVRECLLYGKSSYVYVHKTTINIIGSENNYLLYFINYLHYLLNVIRSNLNYFLNRIRGVANLHEQ